MLSNNNSYIMNIKQVMNNQPVINIGMIGHVSNGKSTIVKSLTGKATQKHSDEKERNITIKLGYANAKIYKCNSCESPDNYASTASNIFQLNCKHCESEMELVNHVSFTDCPGHFFLMATMLNGTCVMDYTILVESLNNDIIPAPQTIEHVKATTLTNTPNKIICINKLDLIKRPEAEKKLNIFQKYASNTILKDSAIIPIAASLGLNMDVLCEELAKLEIPNRKINVPQRMIIIRSFNANKPGTNIKDLKGGIIGGSLLDGMIKINDNVILKPGIIIPNEKYDENNCENTKWNYKPIQSQIISIHSENNKLEQAIPGGLIGVQLDIDPSISSDDGLIGNVMVTLDNEQDFEVFEDIEIEFIPFTNDELCLKKNDKVFVNANANNRSCSIFKFKKNKMILKLLTSPICIKKGDTVTISINTTEGEGITIIGKGIILDGNSSTLIL